MSGKSRLSVSSIGVSTYLLVLAGLAAAVPLQLRAQGATPSSPVKVSAMVTAERFDASFQREHLQFIARKYAGISGLDNHGYGFPGLISDLRAEGSDIEVLCHWSTYEVHPGDERWQLADPNEDMFLHSSDPASLRVVPNQGGAEIWFRRDGRGLRFSQHAEPLGVSEYLVEIAPGPGGTFQVAARLPHRVGQTFYQFREPRPVPGRAYRVRTRLADGRLVPFSGVAQLDPGDSGLAVAQMAPDGRWVLALCYGNGCPTQPDGLVLEVDLNRDRQFSASERMPFQTPVPRADGSLLYTAWPNLRLDRDYAFRVRTTTTPELAIPTGGETYTSSGNNNRITFPRFNSYFVWPDDPRWQDLTRDRMQECLLSGYDGMRFDFAIDSIAQSWVGSAITADWLSGDRERLVDGIASLYEYVAQSAPDATLVFNGYFTMEDQSNYFDFLEHATGADFEFFAYGSEPGATTPAANTLQALSGILWTRYLGKRASALAFDRSGPDNTVARLRALALYLLVSDDDVYFYFGTETAYTYPVYFPEWDVPLGRALVPLLEMTDWTLFLYPQVLMREFESGLVLYNGGAQPVTVELGETLYQLSVSGGTVPELGGDGRATYSPTTQAVLGAGDAAILVRQPLAGS